MAHPYCKFLSNGYRFAANGNTLLFNPCCHLPEAEISSLEDLTNAREKMVEFVENDKTICNYYCNRHNVDHNTSNVGYEHKATMRQFINGMVDDDEIDSIPRVLQLQVDTTCNAACIMCEPKFSSLWAKQRGIVVIKQDIPNFYDQIESLIDLNQLRDIDFLGGEPFVNSNHIYILKKIKEPSLVKLRYVTNGSVVPNNEILEIWSNFKEVTVAFSIDDIEQRYEYIRWPLKWNKVSNNFKQLSNEFATNSSLQHCTIGIHCTSNALSMFYINEIEAWIIENSKFYLFSPCNTRFNSEAVPLALRAAILSKLRSDHPVGYYVKSSYEPSAAKQMIARLEHLDKIRGTSWRETFPEIVQYFK